MFKTFIDSIKRFKFVGKNEIVVDVNEYLALKLKEEVKPLTMAQLTQHQLGSYLPNFKHISLQTDQFKNDLGLFCKETSKSETWVWLITHLKQDQVNNLLFMPNRPSEEWIRGSINGISVVEDIITSLASGYKEPKGLPKKNKEES